MNLNFLYPKLSNPVEVTYLLLKGLSIKVSIPTLKSNLESHPDFPSLLAVSDCLTGWNVSNDVFQVDKQSFDADEMQFPFVAHMNISDGIFYLVNSIKKKQVNYIDDTGNAKITDLDNFLFLWSGVALEAKKTVGSGEDNYHKRVVLDFLNTLKFPFLVVSIFVLLILGQSSHDFHLVNLLLLLKLIGIVITSFLLLHIIDEKNSLVKNLCSVGKKNNCNDVLKSKEANVFEGLSWSEVGFFYFVGTFLAAYFVQHATPVYLWLNIFALPYTIWSLTYQYRNRTWCTLCLTVQFILILEFVTNLILFKNGFWAFSSLTSIDFLKIVIIFLLPVSVWYTIKPILQNAAKVASMTVNLNKFKYNTELFRQVLTSQTRHIVPQTLMPLTIGNPQAQTTITIVSNPFCNPCAVAHQKLDKLVQSRSDIKLQVVFATADSEDDDKTRVSRHLSALAMSKGPDVAELALANWFAQHHKKYEDWAKLYPIKLNDKVLEITKNQKSWCELVEVSVTPTIMVNGYKLPEPYQLDDIAYLID